MKPIHPFPARMAPDLALAGIEKLPAGVRILDPMIGSGTVTRVAVEKPVTAIGIDQDPLAVLMSEVSTSRISLEKLSAAAQSVQRQAKKMRLRDVTLPWIDDCPETHNFIKYWFAPKQRNALRKLSFLLLRDDAIKADRTVRNALLLAMSRLIITKESKASMARDTSRSRPHRVADYNRDFDVIAHYGKSVDYIAKILADRALCGKVTIKRGDARNMGAIADEEIDAIITSPPYLNAIDYMRGHRLSLVWMGYSLQALRKIRSDSVGAEIGRENEYGKTAVVESIYRQMEELKELPAARLQNMVKRYIADTFQILREAHRVLKPQGRAVYVIGDSCLKGVLIKNSQIITLSAGHAGFKRQTIERRDIPINHRSLPFPSSDHSNPLNKRMRHEHVITLEK